MRQHRRARAAAVAIASMLMVATCGGGDSPAPAEPGTTEAETNTTAAPAGSDGPVDLIIEAFDDKEFSTSRLEAPAGVEVTVTFLNKDVSSGEQHNWLVRAPAEDLFTPLTDGPDSSSISFVIDIPGEYKYFCETHAEDMTGVLVVTP